MGGQQEMNRLLYGIPHPCETEMVARKTKCKECNGVGGFYFEKQEYTDREVTREYYLEHKEDCYTISCDECKGKGYITIYEEPESNKKGDIWDFFSFAK